MYPLNSLSHAGYEWQLNDQDVNIEVDLTGAINKGSQLSTGQSVNERACTHIVLYTQRRATFNFNKQCKIHIPIKPYRPTLWAGSSQKD